MSHTQGSTGMDASEIYSMTECGHCGAKLPPVDASGRRRCEFCEATYQATPTAPQPPPAMQAPPNLGGWSAVAAPNMPNMPNGQPQSMGVTYMAPVQTSAKGCGIGMLVFIVILIASIGIPIYFVVRSTSFSAFFADKPDGRATVGPASLNGGKTIFTTVRKAENTNIKYAVARLDEGNPTPVWTSASLTSQSAVSAPMITDGTNVYIPDGEKVLALKASDGTIAWQGQLTDEFQNSCKDCFFIAGDRLVAEAKDSSFHGFSLASGEKAWTKKTKDTTAYAAPFGDKTLILDRDQQSKGVILLINADGTEASALQPTCSKPETRITEAFSNDASVILQPAENAAVFGWGSPYPCWSRIDFGTGQPTWTTVLDNSSFPVGRSDTHVVTQGNKAAIVGGKYIAALNLETGEYTPINEIDDTDMYPLGMRENTLILQTATKRGTTKYAINAVDMTSGEGVWNVDLGKAQPSRGPGATNSFVSTDAARFDAALDGDTFRVIVFDSPSRQLTTHTVAMSSGKQSKASVASGVNESLPYFDVIGWRGATATITFRSGGVIVLDTASNAIPYRYP